MTAAAKETIQMDTATPTLKPTAHLGEQLALQINTAGAWKTLMQFQARELDNLMARVESLYELDLLAGRKASPLRVVTATSPQTVLRFFDMTNGPQGRPLSDARRQWRSPWVPA